MGLGLACRMDRLEEAATSKASPREFFSSFRPLLNMFSSSMPFACHGRPPRLCLQQKVKPPGFDRRRPEFPTDSRPSRPRNFSFLFSVFLALLGAGLHAAAPPPGGHTWDRSVSGITLSLTSVPVPQGFSRWGWDEGVKGREEGNLRL